MTSTVHRVEEYLTSKGSWSQRRSLYVKKASVGDIEKEWLTLNRPGYLAPLKYFLGTAQHESNFALNERDTEAPDATGHRFQSWGIFQISEQEFLSTLPPPSNGSPFLLLELPNAMLCMSLLAARNRQPVREAMEKMGLPKDAPDPTDMSAYLAIAHNQGRSAAVKTILAHGYSWKEYKKRNPTIRIVSSGYGDDVLFS